MTRRQDKKTIEDLEERLDNALTQVKQAEEECRDLTKENARLQTDVKKLTNSNTNESRLRKRAEETARKVDEENTSLRIENYNLKSDTRIGLHHHRGYKMMAEAKSMLQTALMLEKDTNSLALSLVAGTARMLAELCNSEAILTRSQDTLDEVFATLELAMNALSGYTGEPNRSGNEQNVNGLADPKKDGEKDEAACGGRMDVD